MNNGRYIIMKAIVLLSILTTSCTKVEYTGSESTPTETFVRYNLEWADTTGMPSETTVAISRILHTVHMSCMLDSTGSITSVLQDTLMTPCDTVTGLTMPNGEYYIIAFNQDQESFVIDGYQEFICDKGFSMRDIYIRPKSYTDKEVEENFGGSVRFNPNLSYAQSMTHVWSDVKKANIHPDIDTVVTLSPAPLTQDITFRIGIEAGSEVEIKKVDAEISGAAESVQLLTRHISDTTTCKVPFTMESVGIDGTAVIYQGSICTLGLFPAIDATYSTGPGILQVSVTATSEGHEKVFHAGINLKQSIIDAGLTEKAAENERLYRLAAREATIDVNAKLHIEKDQIILDGDGKGVEIWFEKEELEFEI